MLTAQQARSMMPVDSNGVLEEILKLIESRALDGEEEVKIYQSKGITFGSSALYCSEDKYPKSVKEVLSELRKLGYSAGIRCEERQFVDIYLLVKW